MCVDYRTLNSRKRKNSFHLPTGVLPISEDATRDLWSSLDFPASDEKDGGRHEPVGSVGLLR